MSPFKIIVRGDGYWGKGDTIPEALAAMKKRGGKARYYEAFVAHPDTTVDGLGGFGWPQGQWRPVLVDQKLPKGAKA